MKTIMQKIASAIAMALVTISLTFAQTTNLKTIGLDTFKQIDVTFDTDVIFLQSTRNQITLVGDSTFIHAIPVVVDNEILSVHYKQEPQNKLQRVVIEFKDINRVTTGGIGTYYFHKMDQNEVFVLNPYANVVLNGSANKLRVVSQEGFTDISALSTSEEIMNIGEHATLIAKNN